MTRDQATSSTNMLQPIILTPPPVAATSTATAHGGEAIGRAVSLHAWSGSGPDYLHVHHADDEAWVVLEGTLTFKFSDRIVEAPAGTTVFVPAGVPHTYYEDHGPTRYLVILTPRLRALIAALHETPLERHREVLRQFESDLVP